MLKNANLKASSKQERLECLCERLSEDGLYKAE